MWSGCGVKGKTWMKKSRAEKCATLTEWKIKYLKPCEL